MKMRFQCINSVVAVRFAGPGWWINSVKARGMSFSAASRGAPSARQAGLDPHDDRELNLRSTGEQKRKAWRVSDRQGQSQRAISKFHCQEQIDTRSTHVTVRIRATGPIPAACKKDSDQTKP